MSLDPQAGLVDAIMVVAALATIVTLARRWRSFVDETLTDDDKRLAAQAAVFLFPPVVVLIHELGHVAGVLAVGARVVSFHYGVFEGSVGVAGNLTPAGAWLVSLSGNVAGALTGLLLASWGLASARIRPGPRYALILGGMLQIAYALIGYPLLSLTSNWGDWVTIYDFQSTPLLSWATALVHAALLWALWRWWRGDVRQTLFAISSGTGDRLAELRLAVREHPQDEQRWLDLATLYARSGELGLARSTLDAAAGQAPTPRIHLARARVSMLQQNWSSAVVAVDDGLRAAEPDGTDTAQRLWANRGLALTSMERPDHALAAFDHLAPPVVDDARVRYGRGMARIAAGDDAGGRSDLEAVVHALPESHLLRTWAAAKLEGRLPDPPDDSDRPNYLRRSSQPPAPIAGI